MLMPLGGYKGSGLAMAAEILCAVLGGGAMALDVSGIRDRRRSRVSQMFLAIDVAHFMPVEEFTARVERLVGIIKDTPPAPGYAEVMVAGDPEWRTEAERLKRGIPIADGNWKTLCEAAQRVNVAPPAL
jgi:LDH2 family malate/lactate/ureidoglycolate dehydrogenase